MAKKEAEDQMTETQAPEAVPEQVAAASKEKKAKKEATPAERRKSLLLARLKNPGQYPLETLTKFRMELKAIENGVWWPPKKKGPGDPGWQAPPIRSSGRRLFESIVSG